MLIGKAPNTVIAICATVLVGLVIACTTVLIAMNKSPQSLLSTLTTILSASAAVLSAGSFLYSGASAKRADDSATAGEALTNGFLDEKMREILIAHDREVHGIDVTSGPVPPGTVGH